MKLLALFAILAILASCAPLADWGAMSPKRKSASPAKHSYKYIFNEPGLAKGRDDATPCGLPEAAFRGYIEERILPKWEVVEIRYFERNFQFGGPCVGYAIIVYGLKKGNEQ